MGGSNVGALPGATLWGQGLFGGPAAARSAQLIAADIIYAGYRIAGILPTAGRGYSPEEAVDGLLVLNSLIDAWNAEKPTLFAVQQLAVNLVNGTANYLFGPSRAMQRPPFIERASFLFSADAVELHLNIVTPAEWAGIAMKNFTDSLPRKLWYERVLPDGIVHLWPVPDGTGQLLLYLWVLLSQFETTSDPVVLPYGYRHALEWNLGVEFSKRWPLRAKLQPNAEAIAAQAKAGIQALNAWIESSEGVMS